MTIVNAPDEEEGKLRKKRLKKMRKTENWRRRRPPYGVGKVSKQSVQRKWEE
jgi:hypothetical protein